MENQGGSSEPVDIDKTTSVLEPEKNSGSGLHVPGKDRVVFKPPERKSILGLDVLANAKRGGSKVDSAFKVPRERVASIASSMDEEENSASTVIDEVGNDTNSNARGYAGRRYRETSSSEASYLVTNVTEEQVDTPRMHLSNDRIRSEIVAASTGSSGSTRSRSPGYDTNDLGGGRSLNLN